MDGVEERVVVDVASKLLTASHVLLDLPLDLPAEAPWRSLQKAG